ncbi:PLP-dependent aminotransferase family protein [Microtetraspora sp. NBRC 13810]|uniref:MocR-like transcription factor YczR n=1 Tax=Microtetraspora sp. NBRC 13810 TaxID=3030990 RepID=UPI0025542E03|nr:PLP-dependent aminotransferase family protein [Microtetraspora sp. NBRC 13810]
MDRYLSGPQLARLVSVDPAARPYYRALALAVRSLVLDGRLAVRVRLPAERHLAHALGVSRTTVTAAYDLLREQGYLDTRRGAGSWTALPDPSSLSADNPWLAASDEGMLQLHSAAPAATAQLPGALAQAARDLPRHTLGAGYDPLGLAVLREAIAARYTARGLATRPGQILVTAGAQHGIHLVLNLLTGAGDPVLVESPTYPHALDVVRQRGARTVPAGMTDEGWNLDLLTSAMRQSSARLAYVVPDFHNPTGWLMDDATRAALAGAARRNGTLLVADESWAELAVDDVPGAAPLAAFGTDAQVITIGSASKLWWGGLRIGWVRATAALVRRLAALRASVEIASPIFEQLVVARLFERIEEARAERRRTLGAARDALVGALRAELPSWSFTVPAGGGSLWVRLDSPTATPLAEAAACHGVRLAPGPWFGVDGTLENHLRLPFTQPPRVLTEAVSRVATARTAGPYGPRPAASLTPAL